MVVLLVDTDMETLQEEAVPALQGKRPNLDVFWRLGKAKNDKTRLEAAGQVLGSLASCAIQPDYALGRLVRGLAAADPRTRQGFFVCLTEFLRTSDTKYVDVAKIADASLKTAGGQSASKSEEADFLLGRLLTTSAMLRAGIVPAEERPGLLAELLRIGRARSFLLLPALRLVAEHFVPEGGDGLTTILSSLDLASLTLDSLYMVLALLDKDSDLVSPDLTAGLGVKAVFGKKALARYAKVLAVANAPPAAVARHPLLPLLVAALDGAGATGKFWQALSADMTVANNSGLIGWTFLLEVAKRQPSLLPGLLTRHALSVGLQLAAKQVGQPLARQVMALLVAAVKDGKADRLAVVKLLLEQDLAWDKGALGGPVSELLAGCEDGAVVREAGRLLLAGLEGEKAKVAERVHCGGQLARLVGHPAVQADLAWRARLLQGLAGVSLLQGLPGQAKISRQGAEGLRDALGRALDGRNRSLEDGVTLALGLVTWLHGRLAEQGVGLARPGPAGQGAVAEETMEVVRALEARWAGERDKEAGVFLLLHCHMWLQLFLQPDLATEVLEELRPVYQRWQLGKQEEEGGEEPPWVEVVTEILISILASNNRLLRGVAGSVFSVICPQLTEPAMLSLLAVIKKKSQADPDDDEDDEEGDEDDENNEDEDEASEASSEDSDSEPELEEDLADKVTVSGELVQKVSDALGDHAEPESGEDDMDMDLVPDEDMAVLDKKLVEAFRAIGGRKDRLAKKKEAMAALGESHFKLRVLELVELYLGNRPRLALLCTVVPALLEALEAAVRRGGHSELVSRLVAVLGKVASVPGKLGKWTGEEAEGGRVVEVLQGLLGLAGAGSVVVSTLGKVYPRLATALLRLGEACGGQEAALTELYLANLKEFLHSKTCVLPSDTFALALAHAWPGCWPLAARLASEALSAEVRQFRRVAALSLLAGLLANRRLVAEAPDRRAELAAQLRPALTAELARIVTADLLRKVKPKYLQLVFSLLLTLKGSKDEAAAEEVELVAALEAAAGGWPEGRHYLEARKALGRLGKACGRTLHVVVKKQAVPIGGFEKGEAAAEPMVAKKKGKKKKRSQEQLRKAKEQKVDLAKASGEVGVPSFAEFVTDNTEAVGEAEVKKRKGLEDGTSSRDKKHRPKKRKKENDKKE